MYDEIDAILKEILDFDLDAIVRRITLEIPFFTCNVHPSSLYLLSLPD
jgi:hypothetical protein